MKLLAALAAAFAITASTVAQGPPPPTSSWSFDDGPGSFQSADPAATLTTTDDANLTRGADHGAVLEYSYTSKPGQLAGVFGGTTASLSAAKAVRFWLRTSDPSIMLVALNEADGSNYHSGFMSLPDRWQEVALDLNEFVLGDDSTDEDGRLDPGQIQGLGIIDATGFIAQLAEQVPFLVPAELGPRMFWLDDVSLSDEAVAPRWSATEVEGKRAVRLDSFESSPLQWIALAGEGIDLEYDGEYKSDGGFSLRLHYELPPNKLIGILTSPKGPDYTGMKRLRLHVMSEEAITLIVALKEQDESDYNTMVEVQPSNELQLVDLDLGGMTLGDDSTDENGQLDLNQVKELSLADVSVLSGKTVPVNTLWLDDVVFTE